MADDDAALVYDEARDSMSKATRSLKAELTKVRTGQASASLLDGIQVEYYGTPTPLNQLANVTTPDPRLIVVSPYDKGAMSDIEKAEERRKELVKQVHRSAEDHKVGVREHRREALSLLKDLESDGSLSQDEKRREEKRIQVLTDEMVKDLENIAGLKEKEVLQV